MSQGESEFVPSNQSLRESTSYYLAGIFSILILVAVGLVSYELYLYRIGDLPEQWLVQFSLGLLLSIALGLYLVGIYITKRLNRITETAERIMRTGDISQRIPVHDSRDDLNTLSITLNRMLAEIESLVHGIRTVSDNIAHDLRHPLTRMRNKLEEVYENLPNLTPEEQSQQITHLMNECDTLLSTFNGLLRISNIESAKRHTAFEQVELHRVLEDVIDLYEPLANDKSITITSKIDKAMLVGDKDLLFQAIANILDNAIKYTREKGTVDISLTRGKRSIRLDIDDEGPGIPAEHIDKVFTRFYRVDSCRTTPGNGLGLSLVRAIVELHKGTISLSEGLRGGLLLRVTL